jgi:rhodanese-related sulfurtransferase
MPGTHTITSDKLIRLIGTPNCPAILDVRTDEDAATFPFLIPGSVRRSESVQNWPPEAGGGAAIAVCRRGGGISAGVAAWLRAAGGEAEKLEGGIEAWAKAGYPVVRESSLPERDALGRTVWVTRARPKVDRIACPWLIRRFVDPSAAFLFVPPGDIAEVGERFGATPFDVDGAHWSHRGELCTFDVMLEEFGLSGFAPLAHLALIVRGADTARPDLAPQCAGLLAASLGLSRMYSDDNEQLEAGMLIYDALFRWCRDAVDETHDWVSHQPRAKART